VSVAPLLILSGSGGRSRFTHNLRRRHGAV